MPAMLIHKENTETTQNKLHDTCKLEAGYFNRNFC